MGSWTAPGGSATLDGQGDRGALNVRRSSRRVLSAPRTAGQAPPTEVDVAAGSWGGDASRELLRPGRVAAAMVVAALLAACSPGQMTTDGAADDGAAAGGAAPVEEPTPMEGPPDLPPTPTELPPTPGDVPAAGPGEQLQLSGLSYNTPVATSPDLAAFMTYVLENVDAFWTEAYAVGGIPDQPFVYYDWVEADRPQVVTGCGAFTNAAVAYHCAKDDTIYIGLVDAAKYYEGGAGVYAKPTVSGDFSVAFVIAHEYAHNVAWELGWTPLIAREVETQFPTAEQTVQVRVATTINELFADCLAGVWANSTYYQGILEEGDVEEMLALAYAIGGGGAGDFFGGDHGTPDERAAAAWLGYQTGDFDACAERVVLAAFRP